MAVVGTATNRAMSAKPGGAEGSERGGFSEASHFFETCTPCSDRNLERFFAGRARSPTVAGSEEAPCCSPAELQTCCVPEDKAECCGAMTGGGCGCR